FRPFRRPGCGEHTVTASPEALRLLGAAAGAAESTGGTDLLAFDVTGHLPFSDVFLLVTGGSEHHVTAIAREVESEAARAGWSAARREGRDEGRWALVDFGDLVVHVFHAEERS